jgi:MinD-like ATPase involved in chromosome partitioning or flagellar assembly
MKQITFVSGYYGSGKSEVAVNLAINNKIPYLCDLDIVNPYFRSRSVTKVLEQNHIKTISSIDPDAMYLDMPLLSKEIIDLFNQDQVPVIYDLGGSDAGAKIIRQFNTQNKKCDLWFVINVYRDKTNTVQKIIDEIKNIETYAQIKVTGLINNSNLLNLTNEVNVIDSEQIIKTVAQTLNIPIVYTAINKNISSDFHFQGQLLKLQMYLENKTYMSN